MAGSNRQLAAVPHRRLEQLRLPAAESELRGRQQADFYGTVTDEAHLYGLLNRFQSLGLHVLEMRQPPESPPSPW
ncbi:hypothetical protein [Rhodococcus oxybenzonivorans]|uniref:hypothetical protein n=1 Tax=Rhodococcus oxybenzonivorans TaxID=1990687 RepID=UPI001E3E8423|nr:hypothetical protein [Rhodococcus oxybenzonivorans]